MPDFVLPGFKFRFDPTTDTVETHMLVRSTSGETTWAITHQTTTSIFLQGEREYARCADEIREHRARAAIAALPKRVRAKKRAVKHSQPASVTPFPQRQIKA